MESGKFRSKEIEDGKRGRENAEVTKWIFKLGILASQLAIADYRQLRTF